MISFDELLGHGTSAVLVGGGESLARALRGNYQRVIAADPHRALSAGPARKQLQEGEIQYLAGNVAALDQLGAEQDCIVLAFHLAGQDDDQRALAPWFSLLRSGGRLIALEWAAFPRLEDGAPETLHATLLSTLEENARFRRITSKRLVRALQAAGLAHVRQQTIDSTPLFSDADRAYMAAEGISALRELGEEDHPLVKQLRAGKLATVPVTAAYGFRKDPLAIEKARSLADKEQGGESGGETVAIPKAEQGLRDLLALVLRDLTDAPDDAARRLLQTFGARALATIRDPRLIAETAALPMEAARRLVTVLSFAAHLHQPFASGVHEIHGPEDAYRHLAPQMTKLTREHFRGLYLNVKGGLVTDEVISIGTLTSALVHPREVFGTAVERHCHSVLIAHNHPSGDPNPSQEDIHITRELAEAGRLLGIELLDHIVIGKESYVSLKERGYF